MKAEVLLRERHVLAENAFVEIVVWPVPRSVRGSSHHYKYRLILVVSGQCLVRYDNEAGKGDHRHLGEVELPYRLDGHEKLLSDFWSDVELWRRRRT